MTPPALLFDENLPKALQTAIWRQRPLARQVRVGAAEGPRIGSSDAEVLRFAEAERLLLVSRDRRTMPGEVARHIEAGGMTWGVLLVRPDAPLRALVADLVLTLEATDRDEWRGVLSWIPFA